MRTIRIPNLCLVVLVGASGSGKTTFARRAFAPTEVLSSDAFRAMVADDENDQSASPDAFDVLQYVAAKRLAAGRLCVVDATNVQRDARKPLVALAREHYVPAVAIVLDVDERLCVERTRARTDRDFGPHVIRRQRSQLRRSLKGLQREGFASVMVLEDAADVDVERYAPPPDRRELTGPFDIIGDVHGCGDELEDLLGALGYEPGHDEPAAYRHPEGRIAVFVGDLADRGPRVRDVLGVVMAMTAAGTALCVPGNHDVRLARKLRGRNVRMQHGLQESMDDLQAAPEAEREAIADFVDALPHHLLLDGGRLVVAHAGLRAAMHGRDTGAVRGFALYGETTGETDEFGLPVRYPWAREYRGNARVVYGHTPVHSAEWLNDTINIDTGCVFGGSLTALRYPELDLVEVPARREYVAPAKPIEAPARAAQHVHDDVLDIADVTGKRIVATSLIGNVTIPEERAAAALEVMARFAVDPRWLVYLPPTMSPPDTSSRDGLLEHPAEAFAYYRNAGVARVVCEEKHMGSRAIAVLCRDASVGPARFGIDGRGAVYTRTGRPFFDGESGDQLVATMADAVARAGLFEELSSDWAVLDCEVMPWSAKADELIRRQYAATAAAGRAAFTAARKALQTASAPEAAAILEMVDAREKHVDDFAAVYRRYAAPVTGPADVSVGAFHVLASEGHLHTGAAHPWHMERCFRLAAAGGAPFVPTPHRVVDVTDPSAEQAAAEWWEEITASGAEGIVVKPHDFVARGRRGVLQPAIKCRGRDYLRIIYGAHYTEPENLARLRRRSAGLKRSLAVREFALGIEALQRFVDREPLRRVHECVFGVLALESEPVDPRL